MPGVGAPGVTLNLCSRLGDGNRLASLRGSLGRRDGRRQSSGCGSCLVGLWGLRGA